MKKFAIEDLYTDEVVDEIITEQHIIPETKTIHKEEINEGEIRFVEIGTTLYLYTKHKGSLYRVMFTKV